MNHIISDKRIEHIGVGLGVIAFTALAISTLFPTQVKCIYDFSLFVSNLFCVEKRGSYNSLFFSIYRVYVGLLYRSVKVYQG